MITYSGLEQPYTVPQETNTHPADGSTTSATVASLLSQLQAASSHTPVQCIQDSYTAVGGTSTFVETPVLPSLLLPASRAADLRSCTFQQALPHISHLSQDVYVVDQIRNIKQEQARLESRLWADREAIQRKHEERVQRARKKANLIGAELTQFEANSMTDSFRRELQRFDAERVLPAWDGLVARQQTTLESLGVPTMYPSASSEEIQVRFIFSLRSSKEFSEFWKVPSSERCCFRQRRCLLRLRHCHTASSVRRTSPSANITYPQSAVKFSGKAEDKYCTDPRLSVSSRVSSMPYVDIVSKDDYVSLWYKTNTCNNNIGIFDPAKPTLVLLHPCGLDSSWMQPQAEDPRLFNSYNMIMFDMRISGLSETRYTGKYDLWVAAADLAQAFYHLRLPPSHLFATDVFTGAVMRFAALFPELCLSLTLANVTNPTPYVVEQVEELNNLWARAPDLETFEHVCKEMLKLYGGPHAHPDLQDEIVAYWEAYFPPFRRVRSKMQTNAIINAVPLTSTELAAITAPTLIIQADDNQTHSMAWAEQLSQDMSNVQNGATIFRVKTTAGYISIIGASIVNQVLCKFLSRLPRSETPSKLLPVKERLVDFMGRGLARLAELKDKADLFLRDPCSPLSFSCMSAEEEKRQMDGIIEFAKDARKAFSPLGIDGRPMRKFSERHDHGHWLNTGHDGYTRTGMSSFSTRLTTSPPFVS
ncbi:Alpha/Beta hydrolase protein [Cytidiella melzeri]|nr:Alpha/Beta hydrolase protein [Cytidiella melzeri]